MCDDHRRKIISRIKRRESGRISKDSIVRAYEPLYGSGIFKERSDETGSQITRRQLQDELLKIYQQKRYGKIISIPIPFVCLYWNDSKNYASVISNPASLANSMIDFLETFFPL